MKSASDSLTIADGTVTLRRAGSSTPTVANILGRDRDISGRTVRLWVDRLIHRL